MDDITEGVAHQIALELCEFTEKQATTHAWPDDFAGDTVDRARSRARTVIEAMRVPSQAQLIAARDWSYAKYGKPIGNDAATGCWNTMIDAALK